MMAFGAFYFQPLDPDCLKHKQRRYGQCLINILMLTGYSKKPSDRCVSWRGTFCKKMKALISDQQIQSADTTHIEKMLLNNILTFSELWRIRRRWSLSFSRGSLTRRTNERLYSRRLADLWSTEVDRLVCSRALYKSPSESACILQSSPWPGKKDKQWLTKISH